MHDAGNDHGKQAIVVHGYLVGRDIGELQNMGRGIIDMRHALCKLQQALHW